jgi:hypothetical protein
MCDLFTDALDRVRPVFWPALPEPTRAALERIEAALIDTASAPGMLWADEAVRGHAIWAELRRLAPQASVLPGRPLGEPRPYAEQAVRLEGRLLLRRFAENRL